MKNWNFTNGWSLKSTLVNSVSCLLIMNCFITSSLGQAAEQEQLPIEFLEFLGEGIVIEEEYLDPLNYADIDQSDVANKETDDSGTKQTSNGGEQQ